MNGSMACLSLMAWDGGDSHNQIDIYRSDSGDLACIGSVQSSFVLSLIFWLVPPSSLKHADICVEIRFDSSRKYSSLQASSISRNDTNVPSPPGQSPVGRFSGGLGQRRRREPRRHEQKRGKHPRPAAKRGNADSFPRSRCLRLHSPRARLPPPPPCAPPTLTPSLSPPLLPRHSLSPSKWPSH